MAGGHSGKHILKQLFAFSRRVRAAVLAESAGAMDYLTVWQQGRLQVAEEGFRLVHEGLAAASPAADGRNPEGLVEPSLVLLLEPKAEAGFFLGNDRPRTNLNLESLNPQP